jgi:hypothetical protein
MTIQEEYEQYRKECFTKHEEPLIYKEWLIKRTVLKASHGCAKCGKGVKNANPQEG